MDPLFNQTQQALRQPVTPPPAADSAFPDIAQYFNAARSAHLHGAMGSVLGNVAGKDVQYQQAQRQYGHDQAIAGLENQKLDLQAQQTGKLYQRAVNPSGGFSFYDPTGAEISAHDYSVATKKPMSLVLRGSLDPGQSNYLKDYNQVLQLTKLVQDYSGVPQAVKNSIKSIQTKEQNKQPLTADEKTALDYQDYATANPTIVGQKPQDLIFNLMKTHPGVYNLDEQQAAVPEALQNQAPAEAAPSTTAPNQFQQFLARLRAFPLSNSNPGQ